MSKLPVDGGHQSIEIR